MLLCFGRNSKEVFVMLLFFISFLMFILQLIFFLSMFFILLLFFIHIFFWTSSLTLPWTIAGFLHTFYTFGPAHRRVNRDTSIFDHFINLLAASATVLSGHFLPTGVFYLKLVHRHFLPAFIKASLGAGSFPLKFAELHTDLRNTDPAHLFV